MWQRWRIKHICLGPELRCTPLERGKCVISYPVLFLLPRHRFPPTPDSSLGQSVQRGGWMDGWKRPKDAIWQIKLKAEGKLETVWVSFAGSIPELRAWVYF